VKLITHLNLVPRSIMVELYLRSPVYLHGVVLRYSDNFFLCLFRRLQRVRTIFLPSLENDRQELGVS
jgi:hypothetical protein